MLIIVRFFSSSLISQLSNFSIITVEPEPEPEIETRKENPTEWWMQICPEDELDNLEHSSKLILLMAILEQCEAIGDKL